MKSQIILSEKGYFTITLLYLITLISLGNSEIKLFTERALHSVVKLMWPSATIKVKPLFNRAKERCEPYEPASDTVLHTFLCREQPPDE
jgi:hypothetical protein